jgi:cytochrome c-type biogenesis protein CcmH/NrfG
MKKWSIVAYLGIVVVVFVLQRGTTARVNDLVKRQSEEVEVLRTSLEETNTRSEKIIERLAEIEARLDKMQTNLAKLGVRPVPPQKRTPIRDFFGRKKGSELTHGHPTRA